MLETCTKAGRETEEQTKGKEKETEDKTVKVEDGDILKVTQLEKELREAR